MTLTPEANLGRLLLAPRAWMLPQRARIAAPPRTSGVISTCRSPICPHVENVFFDATALRGTYTYWVVNYSGWATDNFELEVALGGNVVETRSGTLSSAVRESPRYMFVY